MSTLFSKKISFFSIADKSKKEYDMNHSKSILLISNRGMRFKLIPFILIFFEQEEISDRKKRICNRALF